MTASVVQLSDYRKSRVRCPETGVSFPQVYRCKGFDWQFVRDPDGKKLLPEKIEPSPNAAQYFTLDLNDNSPLANPTYEAIERLDPASDDGWLILRHHFSIEAAYGYLDAYGDLQTPGWSYEELIQVLFQTADGIFSLTHRKATPTRPNHLLAFITKIPHPRHDMFVDWTRVIAADGKETNEDIFLIPDPDDEDD